MQYGAISFDTAADTTGFMLWQVTNLWQREIRKALLPHGLTHSQFVLLASMQLLARQNREVTQIVLSAQTRIDPMTTSTVLRTLQAKGLIHRQEHKRDTRAKTVALTDKGRELVTQAVVSVEAFDKGFFALLGAELPQFNDQLLLLLAQE